MSNNKKASRLSAKTKNELRMLPGCIKWWNRNILWASWTFGCTENIFSAAKAL